MTILEVEIITPKKREGMGVPNPIDELKKATFFNQIIIIYEYCNTRQAAFDAAFWHV
ncbi:hypothetical protein OAF63_05995 [Saprospiraceae bacterium]|jgi:hypothetical protein|nr:hypothetical protein [Saprospiraceae bacterium]